MNIRKAAEQDIPEILDIYIKARKFMAENGNPTQWPSYYPAEEDVRSDMDNDRCYVCTLGETIVGTFALIFGEEPTYKVIEQGNWRQDKPYATLHRMATNGKAKGVAKVCFDFAKTKIDYLRVDTHEDNLPMQAVIKQNGFEPCGIIYVGNGTPRLAFDWIK